jgi:acyl-CoA dehydrogenase
MPQFKAPVQDTLFILNDLLTLQNYHNLPGFEDLTPETLEAILEEGAKFTNEVTAPLNRIGDSEGCKRLPDGTVQTPKGFKEAFRAYAAGGWMGLSMPENYGGQGLPYVLGAAMNEFLSSANMAHAMYGGLTKGAIAAMLVHANDALKETYLPKMIAGEWTGTMNLTEPHCGTDLGLLKTKAVPQADGSYEITGQKIFISAGDHDMTANIIHLVLARIEGAPQGTKGISLFVVPKVMVNADGSLGAKNGVSCGALEHKMGIHGNSTCVMNYDAATGFLVGEANKGLNAMFVMMNEARLGVGIQGLALSEVAYQNAVSYTQDRLQGRAISGVKAPEKPADPLIVHPDVRRNLMEIKAFNEGARAFMLYAALKSDISHRGQDAKEKQAADDFLSLLTPVLKGFLTDKGFENCVKAQQMFGGHGYIAEWGMEQFVRDARIAMIYEGANGVQALDLVGRKLGKDGGRAIMAYFAELGQFVAENSQEAMMPFTKPLKKASEDLQAATMWLMQNGLSKPDNAGAGSHDYLHLLGLVTIGFMWAKMAKIALTQEKYAKLITARFYMEKILPETALHLTRIQVGCESVMALAANEF